MSVPLAACTQLQHNGDVSGIGVRVSFYVQTVFLGEQRMIEHTFWILSPTQ